MRQATRDRRPPRGTRGTPRSRPPLPNAVLPRCCSATRWTTRPRPCCSGSRAAPAPGRWLGCRRRRASTHGLRADADALDAVADEMAERLMPGCELTLDVAELAALPDAIRTRLLRRAAVAAGAPAGSLSWTHVQSLNELVTAWHGQRWSDLPGGVRCHRRYGRLQFTTGS